MRKKELQFVKKLVLSHLISLLLGGLIFSSVAFASNIQVQFLPLKYFINGERKTTLPGEEGFTYQGRAYVPLRFLSESLGCSVDWERTTSSVYMTITPSDIPGIPKMVEQAVYLTGTWKTESGSIYRLKQNGTDITGTFIHFSDNSKYEFPVTGKVTGNTVELNWTYDNAEIYKTIKAVPLDVATRVVGITETAVLQLKPQTTNTLEGDYFQDYVEWYPNMTAIKKFNGNSEEAKSQMPPIPIKLSFANPI